MNEHADQAMLQAGATYLPGGCRVDPAGVVVAADSAEGAKVAAANQQYAAQVAARDGSDRYTASVSQTLVPLKKHREVQSGGNSNVDTACQASRWDIEDSYAALGKDSKADVDEQLASVLPSGQAMSTGQTLEYTYGAENDNNALQ